MLSIQPLPAAGAFKADPAPNASLIINQATQRCIDYSLSMDRNAIEKGDIESLGCLSQDRFLETGDWIKACINVGRITPDQQKRTPLFAPADAPESVNKLFENANVFHAVSRDNFQELLPTELQEHIAALKKRPTLGQLFTLVRTMYEDERYDEEKDKALIALIEAPLPAHSNPTAEFQRFEALIERLSADVRATYTNKKKITTFIAKLTTSTDGDRLWQIWLHDHPEANPPWATFRRDMARHVDMVQRTRPTQGCAMTVTATDAVPPLFPAPTSAAAAAIAKPAAQAPSFADIWEEPCPLHGTKAASSHKLRECRTAVFFIKKAMAEKATTNDSGGGKQGGSGDKRGGGRGGRGGHSSSGLTQA
jgi:hypothetical protein